MPVETALQGREGVDASKWTLRGAGGGTAGRAAPRDLPLSRAGPSLGSATAKPRGGLPKEDPADSGLSSQATGACPRVPRIRAGRRTSALRTGRGRGFLGEGHRCWGQGSDGPGLPNERQGRHGGPGRVREARTHGMKPPAPNEGPHSNLSKATQVGASHRTRPARGRRRAGGAGPIIQKNPVFLKGPGAVARRASSVRAADARKQPQGDQQHGEYPPRPSPRGTPARSPAIYGRGIGTGTENTNHSGDIDSGPPSVRPDNCAFRLPARRPSRRGASVRSRGQVRGSAPRPDHVTSHTYK